MMLRKAPVLLALLVFALFASHLPPDLRAQTASQRSNIGKPVGVWRTAVLGQQSGLNTVMVELTEPPAVVAAGGAGVLAQPAIRAQSARLLAAQAALQVQLEALGGRVIYSAHLLYNGIAVLLPAEQLERARTLPGVVAIHHLAPKRLLSGGVSFVQAPAVWGGISGLTGRSVRVAVIDTGIDYTHATFGGAGSPAAYAANDPAIVEPGSFPTAKVVGGKDLVGNAYDPVASPDPIADDDPLDCNGHGTLVSSVAAGFGVDATGTRYSGSYNADLPIDTFAVAPGVAPDALLYALKVTGCGDKTTVLGKALEWAIDPNGDGDTSDHLDVATVSLGTPFGSTSDPDAIIAENASAAGMVVVAAAGDSGDTFYSVASPASATSAIAVAALFDLTPGAAGRPDSLLPSSARGPQRSGVTTKPDIAAPGYEVNGAAQGSGNGAGTGSGSSMAAPHVAGAAALLHQLHPDWSPLQIKAALINTASPTQSSGGDPYAPTYAGAGRLNVASAVDTDLLAYFVDAGGGVGVDFGAVWVDSSGLGVRWRRSVDLKIENHGSEARSLALNSFANVAEPGVRARPSRTQITLQPGASTTVRVRAEMSPSKLDFSVDPTVALFQAGLARSYIVEQAGSLVIIDGRGSRIRATNSGPEPLVDVYLNDQLIARGLAFGQTTEYQPRDPGSYTLAYYRPSDDSSRGTLLATRVLNIGAGTDATIISRAVADRPNRLRLLTLIDSGAQGAAAIGRVRFVNNYADLANSALDLYIDGALAVRGLASSVPESPSEPTQLVIPPSGYFALTPGDHTVAFFAPGGSPATGTPVASGAFSVRAGELQTYLAGPGGTQQTFAISSLPRPLIRVPYSITPKTASAARLAADVLTLPAGAAVISATISNDSVRNDPLGWRNRPLVGAFELAYSATQQIDGLATTDAARLRYVGVATDSALTGDVALSQLYFGLVAARDWNTPNEIAYAVLFDTDLDGVVDYQLENTSSGSLFGAGLDDADDAFVTVLSQRQPDGTFVATDLDDLNASPPPQINGIDLMPFNRRVLMMRISADLLGLGIGIGGTRFRYQVVTRHRDADAAGSFATVVDQTPWLEYDLARPIIDATNPNAPFRSLPLYNDTDGTQHGVRVDAVQLTAQPEPRLLLLHFHNAGSQQAQVVPVRAP
ncbi:MAG: S8 family serine peptidase [Chloroflexales bacterium]|nr:S8 family serine peptidase [Chloroflexales bacterium]